MRRRPRTVRWRAAAATRTAIAIRPNRRERTQRLAGESYSPVAPPSLLRCAARLRHLQQSSTQWRRLPTLRGHLPRTRRKALARRCRLGIAQPPPIPPPRRHRHRLGLGGAG